MKDGSSSWTTYRKTGDLDEFKKAVVLVTKATQLCPSGHRHRTDVARFYGKVQLGCYEQDGDLASLEDAITHFAEALELVDSTNSDRAGALHDLGVALAIRYTNNSHTTDLKQAITYYKEALSLCSNDVTGRSLILNSLANAHHSLFLEYGDPEIMDAAVEYGTAALSLCPSGKLNMNRAKILTNLGRAYLDRYTYINGRDDIGKGIAYCSEALRNIDAGVPGSQRCFLNLAEGLRLRFEVEGRAADLHLAIRYDTDALALSPPMHIDHPRTLIDLAFLLHARFQKLHDISDLHTAAKYNEEALACCQAGNIERWNALLGVADSTLVHFETTRNSQDLKNAIQLLKMALEITPAGHPNRPTSLNKLGHALRIRFIYVDWRHRDLTASLAYHREAVALAHTKGFRGSALFGLAKALQARYEKSSRSEVDLQNALEYYQKSLDQRPPGHIKRPAVLLALAEVLKIRYSVTKDANDLERVIAYHEEVHALSSPTTAIGEEIQTSTSEPEGVYDSVHTTTLESEGIDELRHAYGHPCGVSPWSSVASL